MNDDQINAEITEIEQTIIYNENQNKILQEKQEELRNNLHENVIKTQKLADIDARQNKIKEKIEVIQSQIYPYQLEIKNYQLEIKKLNANINKLHNEINTIEEEKCSIFGHAWVVDPYGGGNIYDCTRCRIYQSR